MGRATGNATVCDRALHENRWPAAGWHQAAWTLACDWRVVRRRDRRGERSGRNDGLDASMERPVLFRCHSRDVRRGTGRSTRGSSGGVEITAVWAGRKGRQHLPACRAARPCTKGIYLSPKKLKTRPSRLAILSIRLATRQRKIWLSNATSR